MTSLRLRSPAKLNLYLKVLNKRSDGYHNLVTLFERISLWDDIELSLNKEGQIRIFCNQPEVPRGVANLVFQAAQLLKETFALDNGVDIRIQKRIPVAAGLGGGSSNAATVLMGLNKLWNLSLKHKELVPLAQRIGSDVPFFLYKCSWALGTNRGDDIEPLNLNAKLWHVLVIPRIKIYTKEVFGGLNLRLTKPGDDVNILLHALRKKQFSRLGSLFLNDLESRILQLHPSLGQLKEKLKKLGLGGVSFSGSGPSLYGIATSQRQAEDFKKILSKQYRQVFVVTTL
jgi:4-diphosphocytidyl-2-C-methyl-D-erythritol kinase